MASLGAAGVSGAPGAASKRPMNLTVNSRVGALSSGTGPRSPRSPRFRQPQPEEQPGINLAKDHDQVQLQRGDRVWVAHPTQAYTLATVKQIEEGGSKITIFDEAYQTSTLPRSKILPASNPLNTKGVDDNTELMYLHDAALLDNLRVRYDMQNYYSYTAYILIALNPYHQVPGLYGPERIAEYSNKPIGRKPPHIYALADRAYRSLRASKSNQTIVVSGESGAGKTESCKLITRFLTTVASPASASGQLQQLEERILQSNPLLEAFGNAKTARNVNSSRFGKYTELLFDRKDLHVAGATIETYLLETSRVVRQSAIERNFHIFHYLLAGASDRQRAEFHLASGAGAGKLYAYLAGAAPTIDGVDDAAEFTRVIQAMDVLGVSRVHQNEILRMLAATLHLGNIRFLDADENAAAGGGASETADACKVCPTSQKALEHAAELLCLPADALKRALVTRTMVAGTSARRDVYTLPLRPAEAQGSRDSLAKHLYAGIFRWVVDCVNRAVPVAAGAASGTRTIGLLDLSGFEIFETNSLEQFCINFANEKIQQYFDRQVLGQEQEIYELEGLRWRRVEFKDNAAIIDLVENKRFGILSLLDEECLMPKSTDASLAIKLHTTHTNNEYISKPKIGQGRKRITDREGFVIRHFAGEVTYEVAGFLAKNNDTLHDDLLGLLTRATENPFISGMFATQVADDPTSAQLTTGGRFKSLAGGFQLQLTSLMSKLSATTSHFVRCVKPNDRQQAGLFEPVRVLEQLRYSGMCTALVLMQSGFPTRIGFDELYERYAPLMPEPIARLAPQTFCEALLVALDLHGGRDFQMGLTKVFFRAGKLALMDELTSENRESMQLVVGKVLKWLARKRFRTAIWSVIAANRLAGVLEGVRRVRAFRRAVRLQVILVRAIYRPLAAVRRRLYSEEALRRREAEAARRAAEAEARRAAEAAAEAERQAAEAAARAAAEAEVRRVEEARRQAEEEQRQMLESRISELQAAGTSLREELKNAVTDRESSRAQANMLNERIAMLEGEVERLTTERDSLSGQVATEQQTRAAREADLAATRAALAAERDSRVSAEGALAAERSASAEVTKTLESVKRQKESELAALRQATESDVSAVGAQLSAVLAEKHDLENARREAAAEGARLAERLQAVEQQLAAERQAHQATAAQAEQARQQSEAQLATERQAATERTNAVQANLARETQARIQAAADLETTRGLLQHTAAEASAAQARAEADHASQRQQLVQLATVVKQFRDQHEAQDREITRLRGLAGQLETGLSQARAVGERLGSELAVERAGRMEDAEQASRQAAELRAQAAAEVANKQAVIDAMAIDRRRLDQRVAELTSQLSIIDDLEAQLQEERTLRAERELELSRLRAEFEELQDANRKMNYERQRLINIAIRCQEAQRQLHNVYEKFPKELDLLKLLFGDSSYATAMRGQSLAGSLQKQSGSSAKKWNSRLCVLNDIFLMYFADKKDKEPRGIIRVDQVRCVEPDDNVGKPHTIRVSMFNGRDYFFACEDAADRDQWLQALERAMTPA
ncbi:hypothetical protein H696_04004 [Fonticula alba]|uniref:Myosin heavy chain n=1 Tax=Fonticula alba TaxID=691883 RepID=A0A058Z7T9_FONAL|nr:hypothetical protein H696_04004 [Fonticula alba]KCV69582.1 hypothetical protein H696_04004 [Fonticula alba]|eukprot:XP_009496147.1 hypothetical protein H696_04004 [Fonticula alba]